jgi:hypothetical protein
VSYAIKLCNLNTGGAGGKLPVAALRGIAVTSVEP